MLEDMLGMDLRFLRFDAPDVEELLNKKLTIALAITGGARENAARILGLGYRTVARRVSKRRAKGHKVPEWHKRK